MNETVPLTSKQRQSQATQIRLLNAAFEEFQRHGLAGGRVDRIAERARSNKRLIYIYFGDKDQLFDAVVVRDIEAMIDAVPITAHDLPSYAADLFDYLEDRPEVMRLFAWRNLERTNTSEREKDSYRNKIAQITAGQMAGYISADTPAVHLLAAVLAVIGGWTIASPALREAAGAEDDRAVRRTGVRQAVEKLTASPM